MISTPFGDGVEFDYAKATRLVINRFDLESVRMSWNVNLSASIDAAHMTKNICHTSAGFKMSDPPGKDPLRQMRAFCVDEGSLRDLQPRNIVFFTKIHFDKRDKRIIQTFR
jgi:hypothetical protein